MASTGRRRFTITFDGESVQVGSANELSVVLDVLHGQYDRMVLDQLAPHLVSIIETPLGLIATIKSLSTEDQLYAVDAMGRRLAELIPSGHALRDLLAVLSDPAVEERVLTALGTDHLRRIIHTPDELAECLQWIYGRSDGVMMELLGIDYLRALLKTAQGLSKVLTSLDSSWQAWLLEQIGWERVVSMLGCGPDLAYLVRALPPDLTDRLLSRIGREHLLEMIANEDDWEYLCRRLESAELEYLYALLGVKSNA